jgi:hypothetical protein
VTERLRRCIDAGDAAKLGGEGMTGEVHVQPVRDPAADESRRLELAIPPAMNGLRAGELLRVGEHGELLLALGAASGVDLLRRVEEVVVRLGQSADVREVGAEVKPELGEDGPAERKQPLLPTLPYTRSEQRCASKSRTWILASSPLRTPRRSRQNKARRSRGCLAIVRSRGRASAGRSGATRFSARGRLIRAAGEIAMWPCSSAQLQKARTTDVTFWRVRGDRSPQRSMTSRRSSTETSIGSLSASMMLMRARTASWSRSVDGVAPYSLRNQRR